MNKIYSCIAVFVLVVNFSLAQESFTKYKVQKSETIAQIAKKFNVDKIKGFRA